MLFKLEATAPDQMLKKLLSMGFTQAQAVGVVEGKVFAASVPIANRLNNIGGCTVIEFKPISLHAPVRFY